MAYYVQLNANDQVYVVCESPLLEADNIVEIEAYDESLHGQYYNRSTEVFQPEPPE